MLNNNSHATAKYEKSISNSNLMNYIGDYYILFDKKSKYYYRAKTEVGAFGINKIDFLKVIKKDEELFNIFRLKAFRRYTDHIQNFMDTKLKVDIDRINKTNNFTNVVQVSDIKVSD